MTDRSRDLSVHKVGWISAPRGRSYGQNCRDPPFWRNCVSNIPVIYAPMRTTPSYNRLLQVIWMPPTSTHHSFGRHPWGVHGAPLKGERRGHFDRKVLSFRQFLRRQHQFRYTCRPPGLLPGVIWLGGLGCRMHVQRTCKRFTHQFRLKPPLLRGDRHEVQYLAPSVCIGPQYTHCRPRRSDPGVHVARAPDTP